MEQKMAKVTINGETKEYPCGTSYRDIVDEYQKDTEFPIILVTADGRLRELHKKVKRDCTVRFVTIRDHIGFPPTKEVPAWCSLRRFMMWQVRKLWRRWKSIILSDQDIILQ